MICINPTHTRRRQFFAVADYDLEATLSSGQAFGWHRRDGGWEGVVNGRWVRLSGRADGIQAEAAVDVTNWDWLAEYLQTQLDLATVLATFPNDEPLQLAVKSCPGLRLLRQDPWECLASFILSSTKQIGQIQQIVGLLSERFGEAIATLPGPKRAFGFPTPENLAALEEADLRACKMGFRAPYLLAAARGLARRDLNWADLAAKPIEQARATLMEFSGVGRKIADCVLLFALGFTQAFPVDVWVHKALCQWYFPRQRVTAKHLVQFTETHFGPYAGYAQQYLFHFIRTQPGQDRAS